MEIICWLMPIETAMKNRKEDGCKCQSAFAPVRDATAKMEV